MDTFLVSFFQLFHHLPAEIMSLLVFFVASAAMITFMRFGGVSGLICFIALCCILSNIQVLHVAEFAFMKHPVALGTVLFATTYLATDVLTEHYGARYARLAVGMSFIGQVTFAFLMVLTLAHPPLDHVDGNRTVYEAMETLFLPAPRIMLASLIAYFISQLFDIWVFRALKSKTQGRYVWLRTSVSTLASAFVDNFLFSFLAWIVLSPHPVGWYDLFMTYILGTYLARAAIAILGVPVMYVTYAFKRPDVSGQKEETSIVSAK